MEFERQVGELPDGASRSSTTTGPARRPASRWPCGPSTTAARGSACWSAAGAPGGAAVTRWSRSPPRRSCTSRPRSAAGRRSSSSHAGAPRRSRGTASSRSEIATRAAASSRAGLVAADAADALHGLVRPRCGCRPSPARPWASSPWSTRSASFSSDVAVEPKRAFWSSFGVGSDSRCMLTLRDGSPGRRASVARRRPRRREDRLPPPQRDRDGRLPSGSPEPGLVGRTHECDWPPDGQRRPGDDRGSRRSACAIDLGRDRPAPSPSAMAGSAAASTGSTPRALRRGSPGSDHHPALCGVCAVERGRDRGGGARGMPESPRGAGPWSRSTLDGVLDCLLLVGKAAGAPGQAARRPSRAVRARLDRVARAGRRPASRCRRYLESLDPPYVAGHSGAEPGGDRWPHTYPLGRPAAPRSPPRRSDVVDADPTLLLLMTCGSTAAATLAAARPRPASACSYWTMQAVHEAA